MPIGKVISGQVKKIKKAVQYLNRQFIITKKDIPLNLLKAIEEIAQSNLDIIKFNKEDNTYYLFVETDKDSKNFFKILIDGSKVIGNYEKKHFAYQWKPIDASSALQGITQSSLEGVTKQFETWVKLIRTLHETLSVHDDNFANFYSNFYFEEFKIVDDNANTEPFNPDQQDLVELYIDALAIAIMSSVGQMDEIQKTELISEINEIKLELPTSTKTKVMKKITKIFGKLYKTSKPFAKEIILEAKKQLIKKLIELGIEYGPKILEMIYKN